MRVRAAGCGCTRVGSRRRAACEPPSPSRRVSSSRFSERDKSFSLPGAISLNLSAHRTEMPARRPWAKLVAVTVVPSAFRALALIFVFHETAAAWVFARTTP